MEGYEIKPNYLKYICILNEISKYIHNSSIISCDVSLIEDVARKVMAKSIFKISWVFIR